jgi:hypothetical protein
LIVNKKQFAKQAIDESQNKGNEGGKEFVLRFLRTHEEKPDDFPMSDVYKMCTVLL